MMRSWGFMRQWILKLATGQANGLLWAVFWEADTTGRASMSGLSDLAKLTDQQTLHPSFIGQVIADSGALSECKDNLSADLAENLWAIASMSFVLGMRYSGQNSVVALVNKRIDGARPLRNSALARYEIPTIGIDLGVGLEPPNHLARSPRHRQRDQSVSAADACLLVWSWLGRQARPEGVTRCATLPQAPVLLGDVLTVARTLAASLTGT